MLASFIVVVYNIQPKDIITILPNFCDIGAYGETCLTELTKEIMLTILNLCPPKLSL